MGDRFDEMQYFVYSNSDALAEHNFKRLKQTCLSFGYIYMLFLIISYISQKNFVIRPVYFLIPFVLILFWRIADLISKKKDPGIMAVRIVFLTFYWALSLVVIIIDLKLHPDGGTMLTPMLILMAMAIYVDYFPVFILLEIGILAEYILMAVLMGSTHEFVNNLIVCLAAITAATYGYWVVLGIFTDNSYEERMLKKEGRTDLLTGLLNKISFEKNSTTYLRQRTEPGGVLLIIDFDNFKNVNDKHGHLVGDAILKKFGEILTSNFREADIVGRVGGDEFMVLMTGNVPDNVIADHCNNVEHELNIAKIGEAGGFSCSIGVAKDMAMFDFDRLYKLADDALYEAKARGKAQFVKWESHEITKPEKRIIYIATPDGSLRDRIITTCGKDDYVYMVSSTASEALNEISLYQDHLESVFFDYDNMPDMSKEVLHKYMNSRPIFAQVPVHDVATEL